jgi:hypothetical protein
MYEMIHDIVYYGKGGFDWVTIYNMPIWLRKFTYKRIVEAVEAKNKANENATQQTANGTSRQIDFFAPPPSDIKPGQKL